MATAPWTEDTSDSFLRHADRFEPDRGEQLAVIAAVVGPLGDGTVLDLCTGSGDLSRRLLADNPGCTVVGTDISAAMLAAVRENLAEFGGRFAVEEADLADPGWRRRPVAPAAVVSMLGLHLLDGPQKQRLYEDVFAMLAPGGRLVVADLVAPCGTGATELAARMWDQWVRANNSAADYRLFRESRWNCFEFPGDDHLPSPLPDQLLWLSGAGFSEVDVYWMKAGHAVFGGRRPRS